MTRLSDLTTEELADGICLQAGRIAAAQAALLPWIAEFDRREGWAGSGLLSCAHWLSWRIGLSRATARDQVRVAHRLEELPQLAAAFSDGRISYSKARAITRVAEPDDGIDWVNLGRCSTAAQLEKIVRGVRRAQANEQAEIDPEAAQWSLRTRVRYDDHGNFSYTISGPAQYLPVVQAGIEAKKAELQRQRDAKAAQEAAQEVAQGVAQEVAQSAGVSAEARESDAEPEPTLAPTGPVAEPQEPQVVDLDEQAPGWPEGTTRRDLQAAADSFIASLPRWREPALDDPDSLGQVKEPSPPTPVPSVPTATEDGAAEAPAVHVSAEAPPAATITAATVTDAEALLALAQDALAAEQVTHPACARRRRPQLTAQLDPLSGWGRLPDGELLPPTSLRTC